MARTRLAEKYDVRIWYVAHMAKHGNATILNAHLSPEYATRAKARMAYRDIKKLHPNAYVANLVVFFNPARDSDMVEREELLSRLQ